MYTKYYVQIMQPREKFTAEKWEILEFGPCLEMLVSAQFEAQKFMSNASANFIMS